MFLNLGGWACLSSPAHPSSVAIGPAYNLVLLFFPSCSFLLSPSYNDFSSRLYDSKACGLFPLHIRLCSIMELGKKSLDKISCHFCMTAIPKLHLYHNRYLFKIATNFSIWWHLYSKSLLFPKFCCSMFSCCLVNSPLPLIKLSTLITWLFPVSIVSSQDKNKLVSILFPQLPTLDFGDSCLLSKFESLIGSKKKVHGFEVSLTLFPCVIVNLLLFLQPGPEAQNPHDRL